MSRTPDQHAAALAQLNHHPHCLRPEAAIFVGHRGDEMAGCATCKRAAPINLLLAQVGIVGAKLTNRRYVLVCVRCDRDIPVTSAKPRIPLCAPCARAGRKNRCTTNSPETTWQE